MEKHNRFRGAMILVFLALSMGAVALEAANYVIPTYYGYGLVQRPARDVAPYVVPGWAPWYPGYAARYPGYAWNGYYPWPAGSPGTGYNGYTVGEITCESLRVRSGPSTGDGVLGTVVQGERVWVMGQSGNWYLIQAASGLRGYAHGGYVQLLAAGQQGFGRPPMVGYHPYYPAGYGYAACNPFAAGYDPPRGNWRQFYWWW